jgi:hypothetical protein
MLTDTSDESASTTTTTATTTTTTTTMMTTTSGDVPTTSMPIAVPAAASHAETGERDKIAVSSSVPARALFPGARNCAVDSMLDVTPRRRRETIRAVVADERIECIGDATEQCTA